MRYTYSKKDRIKSSKEIQKLFQSGKAFFSFPLKIILAPAKNSERAMRSAVIAPKKILRQAHKRNKAKRLMREVIRLQIPHIREEEEHPMNTFDFLLVYQGTSESMDYHSMKLALEKLLLQIKEI